MDQFDTLRKRVLLVVTVLTLTFIWGNSMLPADLSAAFSNRVSALLAKLLGQPLDTVHGHGLVRKLAHGTEYLLLGLELMALLRRTMGRTRSLVLLGGISAALIDETIQLFSAGRAGQVQDIWIDLGGFVTGLLLSTLFSRLLSGHNK